MPFKRKQRRRLVRPNLLVVQNSRVRPERHFSRLEVRAADSRICRSHEFKNSGSRAVGLQDKNAADWDELDSGKNSRSNTGDR
jgi:hypothetical protein